MPFMGYLDITDGGLSYSLYDCIFEIGQPVDGRGLPRDIVQCTMLSITVDSPDFMTRHLMEWATDHRMRKNGAITFLKNTVGATWQKIAFTDAFCVYYTQQFNTVATPSSETDTRVNSAMTCTIRLSGMTLTIDDRYVVPGPGYNANNNSAASNSGTGGAMGDDTSSESGSNSDGGSSHGSETANNSSSSPLGESGSNSDGSSSRGSETANNSSSSPLGESGSNSDGSSSRGSETANNNGSSPSGESGSNSDGGSSRGSETANNNGSYSSSESGSNSGGGKRGSEAANNNDSSPSSENQEIGNQLSFD